MGSNLPAIFQECAAASAPTFAFPQSLADKHRPKTIGDFIGLEKPKRILAKFSAQPYPSAWLFVGPSGIEQAQHGLFPCYGYQRRATSHP